ncbi:MAG TPA: hypothetical protein VGM88_15110 [Kofleriaceae bacterium]|jgi:hypothetical protein
MRFVFAGLALAACGGTAHQITIGPPPPKETHAVLAGPLCADNRCTCRDGSGDGGAGVPDDPNHKRYEIRLGPSPHDLWLTVAGGTVLYKSPERAEECFYIDLPTGQQPFELRASNPDGVSVALQINELGAKTKSWYSTFEFKCGSPGVCSFDELDIQKSNYVAAKHNNFDLCGSTKVKGITWDQGKAPDQQHPSEFVLRASLDIYKFAPWKPHGDPSCGEGGGRKDPGATPSEPDPAAQ